jgi:hypothetical protein
MIADPEPGPARGRLRELGEQRPEGRVVAYRREIGVDLEADDIAPTATLARAEAIDGQLSVEPDQGGVEARGHRGPGRDDGGLEASLFRADGAGGQSIAEDDMAVDLLIPRRVREQLACEHRGPGVASPVSSDAPAAGEWGAG